METVMKVKTVNPVNTVNTKVKELGDFIRTQRRSANVSLRKLASLAGVSNPYLSQVERGLRRPSADILQGIAKALRVSSQTLYVKAGMLEESPHPDVHTAIMGDALLTEQQKQVLLQVYDSFREETLRKQPKATSKSKRKASTSKTKAATNGSSPAKKKTSTTRTTRATAARRSTKPGGRTEMQADPSPHPAPLRPPVANVVPPSKEVG
jgi:transcriptional regulator with XRE-family HTH domain